MTEHELATIIAEYINIKDGATWKLKWGELINDTLYLYSSKQDGHWKSIPNHIVNVKRLNVHPVDDAPDYGLAFQLEDRGDVKIVLKPLNTLDMGRWISSLFVAIKGTRITVQHETSEHNDNVIETQAEKAETEEEKEEVHHFVHVKNITQKFEQLAVTEVAEAPRRLSRSLSTPTVTTEEMIDADILEELEDAKRSRERRQRPLSMSEMSDQSLVEVQSLTSSSVVAEKENRDAEVIKCSAGPYRALDADVLRTMVNPFLAKRRLTKQEQQIRKLHKTIDDTVKRIERQRNLMTETREILNELQNRASDMEEREKIIALENECIHLQMQIDESEENVNKYRMLICHIENEIIQSKTAIIQQNCDSEREKQEQVPKEGMKAEMSPDSIQQDQKEKQDEEQDENEQQYRAEPLKFTWSLNGVQNNLSESDSDEDLRHPEMNQDTPDWAKHACIKSKRAYKILAKEGIL